MTEKLRIAILVTSLANKGPIRVVQTLVNTSMRLNLPVTFTIFYLRVHQELQFDCEVRPYHRPSDLLEFDIVHTHGIRPDTIAFMNRRRIKRHLVTIHNYVYDDLRYTYNKVVSQILGRIWIYVWKKADLLVTISHSMADYYKFVLGNKHIVGIPNGIPLTTKSGTVNESDLNKILEFKKSRKLVIGTACAVTKIKGLDQILKAIARKQEYQFMLIGEGKDLKSLIQMADKLNIRDRCLFLGYRTDAFLYFKYFDIFAMPSRSEGFGLTLLEAARNKLPILCSDIQTFQEIFSSDEVQFFKLEDIESLTAALDLVAKKKDQLAAGSHKKFITHYTDEVMALAYLEAYSTLNKVITQEPTGSNI